MKENNFLQKVFEYKDVITLVGLLIICILLVFLIYTIATEGFQCMQNPIEYYEEFVNTSCFCQNHVFNPWGGR